MYHEQYFNYTLTDPKDIIGTVTLSENWVPSSIAATYENVKGLWLAQHWVETIGQSCAGKAAQYGSLE